MEKLLEQITEEQRNLPNLEAFEHFQTDPAAFLSRVRSTTQKTPQFQVLRESVGSKEAERVLSNNLNSVLHYYPSKKRMFALHELHNDLPENITREDISQRMYDLPGRHYPYLNNIIGDEQESKKVKRSVGKALTDVVKVGWPVAASGGAWLAANNAYKAYMGKGIFDRTLGGMGKNLLSYLIPGTGILELGKDIGGIAASEGLASMWGLAATPFLYGIGAYALYRTVKYFLRKRKEKKIRQEQIELLEGLRNELALKNQLIPKMISGQAA